MPSLAEMIAAQKAKQNASTPSADSRPPVTTATVQPAKGTDASPASAADKGASESVPQQSKPAPATGKVGFKFGVAKPAAPLLDGAGGGSGASIDSVVVAEPGPAPVHDTVVAAAPRTFDSLDDIAGATEGEALEREIHPTSMLEGETAATAPTRDLPADLEEGQRTFVESLDSLYDVLFDAELFGNVTKSLMQELQENPEYIKLIVDEDVHTMLRGMRDSMGLARIKKVEAKRSPSTGASRKKAPAAAVSESMNLLEDILGDIDLS